MGIAWRWNKEAHKRSAFETLLDKVIREILPGRDSRRRHWGGAAKPAAKPRRQSFTLEAIEPRLLLSADLTYGAPGSVPGGITNATDISNYVSTLTSTTFVLKAEESSGNAFWNLYATGLDGNASPTLAAQHQITAASDLDVNIKRDDLGVSNSKLSLIDFIGDKVTVDTDSLSVLNARFAGTKIDIDFAGGKDIDIGSLIGIQLPLPLANDQVVLSGNGGSLMRGSSRPITSSLSGLAEMASISSGSV